MKKLGIIGVAALLALSLCACGGGDDAARVNESADMETVNVGGSSASPSAENSPSPTPEESSVEDIVAPEGEGSDEGETTTTETPSAQAATSAAPEETPQEAASESAQTDGGEEANPTPAGDAPALSSEVPEAYKSWVPSSAENVTVNEVDGNAGITLVLPYNYPTVKNHYEKLLASGGYTELSNEVDDANGVWIYHGQSGENSFIYITISDMADSCFITLSFNRG